MPGAASFVYLASQSPRRSQLLAQMGVAHRLLVPAPGQDAAAVEALEAARAGEAPAVYVQRVAALKLDAALLRLQACGGSPAPVLCADTTVALGRTLCGKPENAASALRMLRALSGTTHRVLTAVALQHGTRRLTALSVSRVRFAQVPLARLKAYAASGEPLGKAGAYAIQGRAAHFIEHISGSYSGIMGLPVFETAQLLRQLGWQV